MMTYPADTALILVAILPFQRDLEIARLLGWYRIPFRSSPKVIEVDFLAFYQTNIFGEEHRWRIEYFAEVLGHELTTRQELFKDQPEHPRAREEYFKIQIGPLQVLQKPILAGSWRLMTFLYTTGELFSQAETMEDLVVRSNEREVLWRSLRERAQNSGRYKVDDLPEFPIDISLLAMLGELGKISKQF
jgi:hypothetical protein